MALSAVSKTIEGPRHSGLGKQQELEDTRQLLQGYQIDLIIGV